MRCIDLNSDLGEGYGCWRLGNDEALLKVVSSANIACGFHAGDPEGIFNTLRSACINNVSVGAHVSYPDLVGFGRRFMDITSNQLTADIIYQIGALQGLAKAAGTKVKYVKPHGALYNAIAQDRHQALAVIEAILVSDSSLYLVALAGSPLFEIAQSSGLRVVSEVFADRAYHTDGTLVSRQESGSLLKDPDQVAQRVLQIVKTNKIQSIEGTLITVVADSVCVHGDNQEAVEIAQLVRKILEKNSVEIQDFCTKN